MKCNSTVSTGKSSATGLMDCCFFTHFRSFCSLSMYSLVSPYPQTPLSSRSVNKPNASLIQATTATNYTQRRNWLIRCLALWYHCYEMEWIHFIGLLTRMAFHMRPFFQQLLQSTHTQNVIVQRRPTILMLHVVSLTFLGMQSLRIVC